MARRPRFGSKRSTTRSAPWLSSSPYQFTPYFTVTGIQPIIPRNARPTCRRAGKRPVGMVRSRHNRRSSPVTDDGGPLAYFPTFDQTVLHIRILLSEHFRDPRRIGFEKENRAVGRFGKGTS